MFRRISALPRAIRATLAAGLTVIAAGIVCLYLSDAVARPGSWWQGTFDAFGVGFIVGGIIDVLAISALNTLYAADQKEREDAAKRARSILNGTTGRGTRERAYEAMGLMIGPRGQYLDGVTRQWLLNFVKDSGVADEIARATGWTPPPPQEIHGQAAGTGQAAGAGNRVTGNHAQKLWLGKGPTVSTGAVVRAGPAG